jgi:hypothetical protein
MPGPRSGLGALCGCLLSLSLSGCGINPPLRLNDINGIGAMVELTEVPFHEQEVGHCGPASLLSVLEHSGVATDYQALVDRVFVPGLSGSLQAEMIATARDLGRVAYLLPPDVKAVLAEVEAGRPVLVLLNLGVPSSPRWHYAVGVGFDVPENRLLLRSGDQPRRLVRAPTWLRRWEWAGRWALVLLRPGEWPAGAERARLLQALADFEEVAPEEDAERAWARAVEAWPDESIAWLGLGNATYALDDLPRAEAAYRAALELDAESLPARLNLAMVLRRTERACEGLRGLGPPPAQDHLLAEAFRELAESLDGECWRDSSSSAGGNAGCSQ